jgi:serine/threonine protein kinase
MFLQIVDAMIFLAFNNVVHGDLGCRNVLVFRFDENNPRNNIVKITDFGLGRHSSLYSLASGAAKTTLNIIPVRYVAPEILSKNITPDDYTEKSDVYSMGVLMWEAYSRGTIPWAKFSDDDQVIRRVMNGELLLKPSNCSESYWSIICKTWSKLPKDRPTFSELKHLLTQEYYDTTNISMDLLVLERTILTFINSAFNHNSFKFNSRVQISRKTIFGWMAK